MSGNGRPIHGGKLACDHSVVLLDLFDLGYEAVGKSAIETRADWKSHSRRRDLLRKTEFGCALWNVWGQVDAHN
jgi:hypothetical protein